MKLQLSLLLPALLLAACAHGPDVSANRSAVDPLFNAVTVIDLHDGSPLDRLSIAVRHDCIAAVGDAGETAPFPPASINDKLAIPGLCDRYSGIGLRNELAGHMRHALTLLNVSFLGHADDSAGIGTGTLAYIVLPDPYLPQDIAATHTIVTAVFKDDYLDRGALDAMLSAVRARVAAREARDL